MRFRRIGAPLALLGVAVTSTVTTLVATPSPAEAATSPTAGNGRRPGIAGLMRGLVAGCVALSLSLAAIAGLPMAAQKAAAAGCAQSISGTIKNQLGRVPEGARLSLYTDQYEDNELGDGQYYADIDASGRFRFDLDHRGAACVPPDTGYKIMLSSPFNDGAVQGAPWYWGQVWTGNLKKGQHLSLRLTGQLRGRIKTSTAGSSKLRAPAYKVYDVASNRLVASTDSAPALNGILGSSNYVSVPAGTYRVVMSPVAADDIKPIGATTRTVKVQAGKTSNASFAMRPGGVISGRVTNPAGWIGDATDFVTPGRAGSEQDAVEDIFAPEALGDSYPPNCDSLSTSAGYLVVARQGTRFKRTACMAKSGSFALKSLPPGLYTLRVFHHSPGLEQGRYVTKSGKTVKYRVSEGSTRKAGRITLKAKYPMVKGVITLPRVTGARCAVSLFDSKGKNRTAGSYSTARAAGSKTKISYRAWSSTARKATYRVRFTCTNDVRYIDQWNIDRSSLATHDTWFSGGGKRLKGAKTVTLSPSKPAKLNVTLNGCKRAQARAARVTGTAKAGQTLGVVVTGLAKGAKTYVRWTVNGKVVKAETCNDDDECWFANKRKLTLLPKYKGARIAAQVLVAQNKRWVAVKYTNSVTVG